jgi:hypothetical protein
MDWNIGAWHIVGRNCCIFVLDSLDILFTQSQGAMDCDAQTGANMVVGTLVAK